jgi:hypothetical protein
MAASTPRAIRRSSRRAARKAALRLRLRTGGNGLDLLFDLRSELGGQQVSGSRALQASIVVAIVSRTISQAG